MIEENKQPFNYKTISYMRKILQCKELDEDVKMFKLKEGKLNHKFTDKINKDFRTKFLRENERLHDDIRRVIEFYCFTQNVNYCQGMIDLLLPFMMMKQQTTTKQQWVPLAPSLSDSDQQQQPLLDLSFVYGYFKRFVLLFLPNIIHAKFDGQTGQNTLPYLRCALNLCELLLKYHDKELSNHLKKYGLIFEMFASDWLVTLFTRLVHFNLLYELWEIFLFERDKYFIFYLAVALLSSARVTILQQQSMEQLITFIRSHLRISSFEVLTTIYQ